MTPFGQLCDDVITLTSRPELVAETQLAVRNATQFFHLSDFWQRDCEERLFQFDAAAFLFSLPVSSTMERFRKLRYIKKFDLIASITKESKEDKISECDPNSLFDRYNSIKTNVYYLAGDNLNLRLSTAENGLFASWYKYPNTSPEAYASWIADMYPAAIVNKAAAEIQRDIGMTDDANRREKWAIEIDLPLIRQQDIEATAR